MSVVIPVYNSEKILPHLVERLAKVLPECSDTYEVILVNDGSCDHSWAQIKQLAERHRFIRGLDLTHNYGQHNALLCGIRAAKYEVVVTMDDDLQHPPEEIPKLLAKLSEGYDVVYGWPVHEQHTLWRVLASRLTKVAVGRAMGGEVARHVSSFRAFRTAMREAFRDYTGPFVFLDALLTWATRSFAVVRVRHDPRYAGRSNYSLRRLFIHALNMITGFSVIPLQLASIMGVSLALFGLIVLGYVLLQFLLYGRSVPGFSFLASIIAIFSGAQLLALGIIGEYLARIHFRTMNQPSYVVREEFSPQSE